MYKKRIVINDIAASTGGTLVILKDIYKYICKYGSEYEWIFLVGGEYIEPKVNIKVIVLKDIKQSWIKRLKFDLLSGKRFIERLKPDVVISLQNTITFGLKSKQIVYVHQLLAFQETKKFSFFRKDERLLFIHQYLIGYLIKKSINKADLTIVQTNFMRKLILKQTKVKSEKVIVSTPNLELDDITSNSLSLKNNYFFYPTSEAVYKNYDCIFKACEILNKKLISNFKVFITIKQKEKINSRNIFFLGNLPREEVIKRYKDSVLIFPSYIETLGLPLVEARKAGTIILTSDCEFSHELLDDYKNVYFFNPFNPNELAKLIEDKINGKIRLYRNVDKEINNKNRDWQVLFKNI